MALCVAFAWGIDHRPGLLQHGDEVRKNERLREQVLGGTEESWPLPAPLSFAVHEVTAMALPEGNVAAGQSLADAVGRRGAAHPGGRVSLLDAGIEACLLLLLALGTVVVGHQRFEFLDYMEKYLIIL